MPVNAGNLFKRNPFRRAFMPRVDTGREGSFRKPLADLFQRIGAGLLAAVMEIELHRHEINGLGVGKQSRFGVTNVI